MRTLIAVPSTGRRPVKDLLARLAAQMTSGDEILVVHNAAASSSVLAEMCSNENARYFWLDAAGYASARNACVDIAQNEEFDFLAFIDDDEMPCTDWPGKLVSMAIGYDADVVAGPVRAEYARGAPRWLVEGQFPPRVRQRLSGPFTGDVRGSNVLIRIEKVASSLVRFSTDFDSSGGEDTLFFRNLGRSGAQFVWCQEAYTVERLDRDRESLRYMLSRARVNGRNIRRIDQVTLSAHQVRTATVRAAGRSLRGACLLVRGCLTMSTATMAIGLYDLTYCLGRLAPDIPGTEMWSRMAKVVIGHKPT